MPETDSDQGTLAQASLVELRSSLKWLVAGAGAVAATLVAGIQLTATPTEAMSVAQRAIAGASLLVGLLLIFMFLRAAVLVMTLPRPTASDLTKRERRSNVKEALGSGTAKINDSLIESLYAQKSYLFSESPSIADLYEVDYVQARNALDQLKDGNTATWRGRERKPTDAERDALQATVADAQQRLSVLEDVSHLELTRQDYRRLVNPFPIWAIVFVIAVCAFAIATHPAPQSGASITNPANARLIITDRGKAGLPSQCDAHELQAVAIGGTWNAPTVVTTPTTECPSRLITKGSGILAIPIVPIQPVGKAP